MLSTFWSALWRSGSNRTRPVRPRGVRLFLEPLEERALLDGGLSGGGPVPSSSTDSTSGSQPGVVQTTSGSSGSSGSTGSGSIGISGPGYPLAPSSGPTLPPPTQSQPVTVLVPISGTPGGSSTSLGVVAVCTSGGPSPSGSSGSSTGL
jgi:hypothetical protein